MSTCGCQIGERSYSQTNRMPIVKATSWTFIQLHVINEQVGARPLANVMSVSLSVCMNDPSFNHLEKKRKTLNFNQSHKQYPLTFRYTISVSC